MTIPFTCPYCGARTNVADRYAGQSGPCGHCGQTITVPGTTDVPAGAPADAPFPPPRKSGSGPWVLVAILVSVFGMILVCGGILVALLLPAVQAAREAARRMQCTNNMKQITLALHNYHDAYGQFPPAYTVDDTGKPLHSWRVLILPYMEDSYLYEQIRLDEPWDSPHNMAVAGQYCPHYYRCASDAVGNFTDTSYVMVVGPGCISDGSGAKSIADVKDGTSNTILVVEMADSGIRWTEPRDLDAVTMSYQLNDPANKSCISSMHPGGVNVAMADGSVQFLSEHTDQNTVREMTLIDDQATTQSVLFP
ncbi:MAG: DUF1559 domain-containing protein [Pirellulaceae bacterium]|nr:DUF1559 domain-containing protein [Pirellulaceae bacterium]